MHISNEIELTIFVFTRILLGELKKKKKLTKPGAEAHAYGHSYPEAEDLPGQCSETAPQKITTTIKTIIT
jgi:hypothetical protein